MAARGRRLAPADHRPAWSACRFVMQTVTSPGLWGVKSAPDEAYLD
jgi:hypothetical protein